MERDEGEWFFPAMLLLLMAIAVVLVLRGDRNGITTVVAVVSIAWGSVTLLRRELGFSLGEDGPWQAICRGVPAVACGMLLLAFGAFILLT